MNFLTLSLEAMGKRQKSYFTDKSVNGVNDQNRAWWDINGEIFAKKNFYRKIPDLYELPVTVVNNVLYSSSNNLKTD